MELVKNDVRYVVQRLPRDVRELLSINAPNILVGGGFIRATIAGETPSDIDIFGDDPVRLDLVAKDLQQKRPGSKISKTKNAITLVTPNRLPIQFITRWTFSDACKLVQSFDFTVCQAAIWRENTKSNSQWFSQIGDDFYIDLAGRRLVYTNPKRDEEAGGSMLRVIKYIKRGYSIQVTSLGNVIGRLTTAMNKERAEKSHLTEGEIIAGLLREVDPLLVIDGFEVVDDHAPIEGEE